MVCAASTYATVLLLGVVARATGPPDWFDACQSGNATIVQQHCCNDTHVAGCTLRVMRKPNGTAPNDTHAARFAVDQPWNLTYEYTVPARKPSGALSPSATYYIWGDTDFDTCACRVPRCSLHNHVRAAPLCIFAYRGCFPG